MNGPTVLIVADAEDAGAAAVAEATAARLPGHSVVVVRPVELTAASWSHRVGSDGSVATAVRLRSGLRLRDADLAAVLVRSEATPIPSFSRSMRADRDYAAAELRALLVSWVRSLGPKAVNEPGGISLGGPSWTPRRWLVEAHRAGLPVASSTLTSSARLLPTWRGSPYDARRPFDTAALVADGARRETVTVAGGQVIGAVGAEDGHAACLRLAAQARCRLLELVVTVDLDSVGVLSVTPGAVLARPYDADAPAVVAVSNLLADVSNGVGR